MSPTPTLDARLRSAALRLRFARALDSAVLGASLGLLSLALSWLGHAGLPAYLPLAFAALAAAIASLLRVPELPILSRLDRAHELHDLLSSAWSCARQPAAGQRAMTRALLARAERAAATLDLSRAEPWRAPRHLPWLLGALLLAASAWAWSGTRPLPPSAAVGLAHPAFPATPRPGERLLPDTALTAFHEQLARLDPEPSSEGAAAVLRNELDALLDRIAREPMDRLDALRALRQLESRADALAAKLAGSGADSPQQQGQSSATQQPSAHPPAAPPKPEHEREHENEHESSPGSKSQPGSSGQPQPQPPGSPNQAAAPPGGLPQPTAAAPAGPRNHDPTPGGPELERRPVPKDPERARGLKDAIAELRDMLRHEPPSGNPASAPPNSPQTSEPADDRSERPGTAAASAAAQKPSSGDAAKPEPEAPQLPAAATRIDAAQGSGPLRSQVIYGAAERGFAGRDYARVHAEYEDHAERELERDQLPPGYRGYVRRYFQAIAPRPSP